MFAPCDFPGVPGSGVGTGEKVCCFFFLQCDPRDAWAEHFANLSDAVDASGVATIGLVAPFIPVIPGTETYMDELW